jgi:hypothetical protein
MREIRELSTLAIFKKAEVAFWSVSSRDLFCRLWSLNKKCQKTLYAILKGFRPPLVTK